MDTQPEPTDDLFPADELSSLPDVVDFGNTVLNTLYEALTGFHAEIAKMYPTRYWRRLQPYKDVPENELLNAIRRANAFDMNTMLSHEVAYDILEMLRHMDFENPVLRPLLTLMYPNDAHD